MSSKKGVHSPKDSEKEIKVVKEEVIFLALESLDISDLWDTEWKSKERELIAGRQEEHRFMTQGRNFLKLKVLLMR